MPCKPRKAKILLKQKKAKVVKMTPFTIQLLRPTKRNVQKINLGIDVGYNHVGLSAITNSKEIYAEEIHLREDIVSLNSERRQYRKSRRYRKTWYRKPRFLNRKKDKGWLAPSIKHKLDSHVKVIKKVKKILPISKIIVEVASFDIQKIKNPNISDKEYQEGDQLGFWNVREYVFHRDNHKCQNCIGKSKDTILNVHHITSRKTGGNRPDNLITLCKTCHLKYHDNELKISFKKSKNFKAETFISSIRWKLIEILKIENNISYTFGYKTKRNRILQKLKKSHITDAFVIAGGTNQIRQSGFFYTKQVRRSNRKLFKGIRSHLKNTATRFIKGFQRFDKVFWNKKTCFIFGRRKTGYFDLRQLNGVKIHASAKAKDCILLETFKTFLTEWRVGVSSHP
ncbi:MAG: hypothetical protein K1060chlam1_00227 [Candidatus Anoxychlamydiales bacterium]|nr:hypothetical protein [Candidatus Anoxychlamydiales bacterium]